MTFTITAASLLNFFSFNWHPWNFHIFNWHRNYLFAKFCWFPKKQKKREQQRSSFSTSFSISKKSFRKLRHGLGISQSFTSDGTLSWRDARYFQLLQFLRAVKKRKSLEGFKGEHRYGGTTWMSNFFGENPWVSLAKDFSGAEKCGNFIFWYSPGTGGV